MLYKMNKKGNYFIVALIIVFVVLLFYFSYSIEAGNQTANKVLSLLGFPVGWLGAFKFIQNLAYVFLYSALSYMLFVALGERFFESFQFKDSSIKGLNVLLEKYSDWFESFFFGSWLAFDSKVIKFSLVYTILFSIPVLNRVLEVISLQIIPYMIAWISSNSVWNLVIVAVISLIFFVLYLIYRLNMIISLPGQIRSVAVGMLRIRAILRSVIVTAIFFAVILTIELGLKNLLGLSVVSSLLKFVLSTVALSAELLLLFVIIPFVVIFFITLRATWRNLKEELITSPLIAAYRKEKQTAQIKKATEEAVRGFELIRKAGRLTKGASK